MMRKKYFFPTNTKINMKFFRLIYIFKSNNVFSVGFLFIYFVIVVFVGGCVCIGMSFIRENLSKIGNDNAEHMPIGFEVTFPSLIEIGRNIGIDIPDNSPVLFDIYIYI